ncbi:unnamed protein product [Hymenolepis diminuta]|uniref:Uncharacterized protein n=1 Tax=Hymenolepis diminuta TaxID=6216 RepID=A0A564YSJ5_HYMDI|nr:unnamed protein product [Hymenolepis diminuta]
MVSGSPWVENIQRRLSISMPVLVDFNGITWGHFECETIAKRYRRLLISPTESKYMRNHESKVVDQLFQYHFLFQASMQTFSQ